jgi:hypothetical protein
MNMSENGPSLKGLSLRSTTSPTQWLAQPGQQMDAQALLAQLGSEVANSLSSALERVNALTASGRIDRTSLRLLREEIDAARRAGIMGQQVERLGSGRVKMARERLNLTALLRETLMQRSREISVRGLEVRQELSPVTVLSDATLVYSMLETLMDWCFAHTVGRVDLRLQVTGWPNVAHLSGSFLHCPPDEVDHGGKLDSMAWRLLQQTAVVLGLHLKRRQHEGRTDFSFEFPDTVTPTLAESQQMLDAERSEHSTLSHNSQPLAGRHVLVLAARREVRNLVRETLKPLGLMLDFASSVDEARHLCTGGLPHGVVYDGTLASDALEALRHELTAEMPSLAFIHIADHGKAFEVLNLGGSQVASVGRDVIADALPAALMFELARHG